MRYAYLVLCILFSMIIVSNANAGQANRGQYLIGLCDSKYECYGDGTHDSPVAYVPDRLNRTLIEEVLVGSYPPLILHRIDRP
jgi:hypothetical protein